MPRLRLHGTNDGQPCWFMRQWVSALSDNTLKGWARWYANLHVARCPNCKTALEDLTALHERMQRLGQTPPPTLFLTEERRTALQTALDALDAKETHAKQDVPTKSGPDRQ